MSRQLDIETLEHRVLDDPGAPGFATLAEAYRRLGRLDNARRTAIAGLAVHPDDTQGRLALGLTLLDLGEPAAARYELERAMAGAAGPELDALVPERDADATSAGAAMAAGDITHPGLADAELEAAFENARPVADEMIDANQIAEQAMRAGRLDEPEGFQVESAPTFATETMARLLDEQGDREAADVIRERLHSDPVSRPEPLDAAQLPDDPPVAAAPASRANGVHTPPPDRPIETLEFWLENLRRSHS